MKSKAKTYILLVIVIGIWGTIGFKIWDGLKDQGTEQIAQQTLEAFKPMKVTQVENFSIEEVLRDPFFGTIKKQVTPSEKIIKKEPIVWRPIIYKGVVKNTKTKKQIYVVQIGNTEYLLKPGHQVDDVNLISGSSKAIVVKYKGEQKRIKLQE